MRFVRIRSIVQLTSFFSPLKQLNTHTHTHTHTHSHSWDGSDRRHYLESSLERLNLCELVVSNWIDHVEVRAILIIPVLSRVHPIGLELHGRDSIVLLHFGHKLQRLREEVKSVNHHDGDVREKLLPIKHILKEGRAETGQQRIAKTDHAVKRKQGYAFYSRFRFRLRLNPRLTRITMSPTMNAFVMIGLSNDATARRMSTDSCDTKRLSRASADSLFHAASFRGCTGVFCSGKMENAPLSTCPARDERSGWTVRLLL